MFCLLLVSLSSLSDSSDIEAAIESQGPAKFLSTIHGNATQRRIALRSLKRSWRASYIPPLIETLRFAPNETTAIAIADLLRLKTRQKFGVDYQRWHKWAWNQKIVPDSGYADFKATLYQTIDPKFTNYFSETHPVEIDLTEVVWGGVVQDGIPPLRSPKMIEVEGASYLEDDHIVFALEINGDVRAYPKRIMGWHEMVVDRVGGVDIVGVYCTLCGSMIVYETKTDDALHEMGTSGFLYRSNKLMYDKATQSLWNSFWGRPVVGPLVGQNVELKRLSVVTTNWGAWRDRHPDTTVLALPSTYAVDYGEGVAYQGYYSHDRLLFQVPDTDKRLKNKDEILGLTLAGATPLAISVSYLKRMPMYYDKLGEAPIVILTDKSGAARVFDGSVRFTSWDGDVSLQDQSGSTWRLSEAGLHGPNGLLLDRMPAHRAFWFGWYAAYSNTRLIN